MATWKQVILKDPITGEYLAPMGGNFSGGDADTLQSHPASDFLLRSEYTPTEPVDLSEYLKTATADSKYAGINHKHTQDQITGLSSALSGKANTSHSHTITDVTGLQNKLDSLEESKSSGLQFISSTSFSADTATYNLNLPDNWVKYKELIVYLIIPVNGTVTESGTNIDTVDLGFNNNITFYNMSAANTSTKYGLGTKTTTRYRGYIRLAPVGGSSACCAVRGEIFALEDLAWINNTTGYLTEFKLIPRIAANQLTYLKFTCNGSCTMRNCNFSFYALN